MTPPVRILIYGEDCSLLETRGMVLRGQGYQVVTSTELPAVTELLASQTIQILILCHSLTEESREGALGASHSCACHTANLILSPTASCSSKNSRDAALTGFVDPRALIDSLRQLTAECSRTTDDERQLQGFSALPHTM